MNKKKAIKILLILILFMLIAIFVLKKYVIEEPAIAERIGAYMPVSISLNDSIRIKTYSTTTYFKLIEDGKYKMAYDMLTEEYRKYVPYEKYLQILENYNCMNFVVKSVKQLTDYTYVILLEDRDTKEEHLYTVYSNKFNNKVFTISPDKFLYYDEPNIKKTANGLEVILEAYLVLQDSIDIKLKVTNKTSKPIEIEDVKVELALAGRLADKFTEMTIAPKEEKEFHVVYNETSYYIPKNILIETEKTTLMFEL